jgi:hypothetical protein
MYEQQWKKPISNVRNIERDLLDKKLYGNDKTARKCNNILQGGILKTIKKFTAFYGQQRLFVTQFSCYFHLLRS